MSQDHPSWTSDEKMIGTVASYNVGTGNVRTQPTDAASWAQLDAGSAHDNSSRDTIARAQGFAENLDGSQ